MDAVVNMGSGSDMGKRRVAVVFRDGFFTDAMCSFANYFYFVFD